MKVNLDLSPQHRKNQRYQSLFFLGSFKLFAPGLSLLLLASLVLFAGGKSAKAAPAPSIDCTHGQTPQMTIKIYNNSKRYAIYPVLFAGAASDTDTWIQACFGLTNNQLKANPYPRATQYRMYINCCAPGENGIPAGGSVTITLPLYSPLVTSINPALGGQLTDWWQGGGINFYYGENDASSPPQTLTNHWESDQDKVITPVSNPPTCAGCALHFFTAPNSIPNSDPQQLVEYTLGAQPINPDSGSAQPARLWVPNNVDYDISYVNYVYMPAAIEPYGNPLIGWIGSPITIVDFNSSVTNWYGSSLGADWPLYKDAGGAVIPNKIPSALEIFLNTAAFDNTSVFLPAPAKSAPIASMVTEWEDCVNKNGTDTICPLIRSVTDLMNASYTNYYNTWQNDRATWTNNWQCTGVPVAKTEQLLLSHLYGWTPFLENCKNTGVNQLYDTPGYNDPSQAVNYQTVKAQFDQLQYWVNVLKGDYGKFDPYVALVHGPNYLNAPYTYAYSVDDAVGNMQTDGTGLIIGVAGLENLPNPDHATPNVNFPFGYSSSYDGGINFAQYGRCTTTPDTPTVSYFTSFAVPEGIQNTASSVENCTISMADSRGRLYQFKLKGWPTGFSTNPNPTPQERSAANAQFIDCTGNTGQVLNWCMDIYPYQQINPTDPRAAVNYYVVMGGPPPLN
jgi:hypothetical protein